MEKILIKVKQNHIDNGKQRNCHSCPIALACGSIFGFGKVIVTTTHLTILDDYENVDRVYKLPQVAMNFISNFDAGLEVLPFSFELEFT